MLALSVRQPWAWLLIHGGKDIENRIWNTGVRGHVLIHAAKGMTKDEYQEAAEFAATLGVTVPPREQLDRGGIIGSVNITDCITQSDSPWFFGPFGFKCANPKTTPFIPYRGQLGFFHVPVEAMP